MFRHVRTAICIAALAVAVTVPHPLPAQTPKDDGDPLFTKRLENPYGPPVSSTWA